MIHHEINIPPEFNSIVTCFYCQRKFTVNNQWTVDHIIPRSKGGTDRRYNKLKCCSRCNTYKGSLMPHEFYFKVLRNGIEWGDKEHTLTQIMKVVNYLRNVPMKVRPFSVKEKNTLDRLKVVLREISIS